MHTADTSSKVEINWDLAATLELPDAFRHVKCLLELSVFGMDTRLTRFNSKLSELRNTLLAAPEIVPAMSRAASIFLESDEGRVLLDGLSDQSR